MVNVGKYTIHGCCGKGTRWPLRSLHMEKITPLTCRGDGNPVTYLFSAICRGYVPLLSLILGPAIRAGKRVIGVTLRFSFEVFYLGKGGWKNGLGDWNGWNSPVKQQIKVQGYWKKQTNSTEFVALHLFYLGWFHMLFTGFILFSGGRDFFHQQY